MNVCATIIHNATLHEKFDPITPKCLAGGYPNTEKRQMNPPPQGNECNMDIKHDENDLPTGIIWPKNSSVKTLQVLISKDMQQYAKKNVFAESKHHYEIDVHV